MASIQARPRTARPGGLKSGLLRVEKFSEEKVWTAVLIDADNDNYLYIKRFNFERTAQTRHLNFLGDNPNCRLMALTDQAYPRFRVEFAAPDDFREPIEVDAFGAAS